MKTVTAAAHVHFNVGQRDVKVTVDHMDTDVNLTWTETDPFALYLSVPFPPNYATILPTPPTWVLSVEHFQDLTAGGDGNVVQGVTTAFMRWIRDRGNPHFIEFFGEMRDENFMAAQHENTKRVGEMMGMPMTDEQVDAALAESTFEITAAFYEPGMDEVKALASHIVANMPAQAVSGTDLDTELRALLEGE